MWSDQDLMVHILLDVRMGVYDITWLTHGVCNDTDLFMLDADDDRLLPILLAAAEAEDAGNLEDLRWEEEPCPAPKDNLMTAAQIKSDQSVNWLVIAPISSVDWLKPWTSQGPVRDQ